MQAQEQAAKVLGPQANATGSMVQDKTIAVLPITTSTVVLDIIGDGTAASTNPGLLPKADGRIVKITPEVDVYYIWTNNASQVLDETQTGSTNIEQQCDRMYAGQPIQEYPQGRYLAVKGVAGGKARMSVASS